MMDDDLETDMAVRITSINLLSQCNNNIPPKDIVLHATAIYDWLMASGETGRDTVELQRVN